MPDLDAVPPLDLSISVVDPAGVVYDTFDGFFVPVTEASPRVVRELRDLIKPIYVPE